MHPEKYIFGQQQLICFRDCVDDICSLPCRVTAIEDYPQPSTVWQLRWFLGLINFYYYTCSTTYVEPRSQGNTHRHCSHWKPLSYPALEATIEAFICKFQPLIEGCPYSLITDHKQLIHAWTRRKGLWSHRQDIYKFWLISWLMLCIKLAQITQASWLQLHWAWSLIPWSRHKATALNFVHS